MPASAADMESFRGFKRLRTAIDVNAVTVVAPQGTVGALSQFRGRWVLMNLWATWCAPCIAELPMLNALAAQRTLPDLDVIAVSMDINRSQAEIKAFLARHKTGDFASYMDNKLSLSLALKTQGLPMTYLINPDGKIVAEYRGAADWTDPKVVQALSFFVNSGNTANKSPTKP